MRRFLTFALPVFLMAGCANISSLFSTPEPTPVSTNTPVAIATSTSTTTPTVTPGGPRTLRVWVPPQFDPAAETPAGAILQERLDEFIARRPGLQIEIRVKSESGVSSLLNSLSATRAAAPSVMPDLVALSRIDLEAAASDGLLHPLDGLTTLLDDPDWYTYARQLAHIQTTAFGLPFAGDTLALVGYNTQLPTTWDELPEETLFIFPAADPQALFSISLYLSAGGTLSDDQGLPTVDEEILAEMLSFFVPPEENQLISPLVITFESDEQVWNALTEQRGNLAVNLASSFLEDQRATLNLAPLPGLEAGQYTLATGWSWALAGSNPENQPLAVELAEFLSDSQFLAEWTQAAGYLPTRPTALAAWEDVNSKMGLAQTAESANLIPGEDLLVTLGPLFTEATLSVLNGEQLPAEAAQSVIDQIE